METLIGNLKENEKFKIFENGVIWKVIETNPICYDNAIRAKGKKITTPFNKQITCIKIE